MKSLSFWKKWFEDNIEQIQKDYFAFLEIPSISSDPSCKNHIFRCADFVKNYLNAELIQTESYPLVFLDDNPLEKNLKTVLLYGHYDVQPVDPIELWKSDPFKPEIRDQKVFARGALDDKGQIFYAMLAYKALKSLDCPFKYRVKFLIEGQEESGSAGLIEALAKNKEKFACDDIVVVDFDSFDEKTPAVTMGARGLLAFDIHVKGSHEDLHSGVHGGLAYNPIRALCEMLACVWDANGRVCIEGFYDGVQDLSFYDLEKCTFPFEKNSYSKTFGVHAFGGQKDKSLMENNWFLPTFEINGMTGGFTGSGSKTIIPKEAKAKISCRIVAGQDPKKMFLEIEKFFQAQAPSGMQVKLEYIMGERAFISDSNSEVVQDIIDASEEVMQNRCKHVFCGASIPVISKMQHVLNCNAIGMGYGLSTDSIHAPNEHFDMKRLEKGFLTIVRMLSV